MRWSHPTSRIRSLVTYHKERISCASLGTRYNAASRRHTAPELAAALATRLTHRDINPPRILPETAVERLNITHFGPSRPADVSFLTAAATAAVTPLPISPDLPL